VTLLIGALTIGFILSLLALGVLISFRIYSFADITAEGSITLGAAVAATLLVRGVNPLTATVIAIIAGMLAGAATGILHTRFKINGLLSGILVMTALYSINLHIMGRSNVPLLSSTTFMTWAEHAGAGVFHGAENIGIAGWEVNARDISVLIFTALAAVIVGLIIYVFFCTDLGTAMRATGDNAQMVRAMGISDGNMVVLGLALSNGLVALAGALLAQYQGFSDVQMGIGMLVWGLASVIIGEALVGVKQLNLLITGALMGSVLFRLLVAIALRWGLDPNDLKLITAGFVFLALILPSMLTRAGARKAKVGNA
jgi:putative ABC transport system permease protein